MSVRATGRAPDRDVSLGAATLALDFLRCRGASGVAAAGLVLAGALLEGAGLLLLVPIVALALDTSGTVAAPSGASAAIAALADAVGASSDRARLALLLTVFCTVIVLRFAVLLLRDGMLARIEEEFVLALRRRAFRRLAALPWSEAAGLRQTPLVRALTSDVDRAAVGVGALVAGGVAAAVLAVQFVLALALAPLVTLMAAAVALAVFRSLGGLRRRASERGADLTAGGLALLDSASAFLRGLKAAKAHGLEARYVRRFEEAARVVADTNRGFVTDQALARQLLQAAAALIGVAAVVLGLFVLATPPENLVVALLILARLYSPLQVIQNTQQAIRHAAEGYREARRVAGPPAGPLPPLAETPAAPLAAAPEIRLEEITVGGATADRPAILREVSLALPPGSVTALVGESGAGKSTLCDVVAGLIAPDAGVVRLDGRPLDVLLLARLRASLAYVGQEPALFEPTVRETLSWGTTGANDAQLWRALEIVGAAGIVRRLPGGLDAPLAADGTGLSGGERQRLRLAAALLRRPRLLILDEATGALDAGSEMAVLAAVLAARDGATTLLVSHRPAVLVLVDRVVTLAGGRVVACASATPPAGLRDAASGDLAGGTRPA